MSDRELLQLKNVVLIPPSYEEFIRIYTLLGGSEKPPLEEKGPYYIIRFVDEILWIYKKDFNVMTYCKDYPVIYSDTVSPTRSVEISLKKAREWYKSGNETLKELALLVYSIDELKISLEEITNHTFQKQISIPKQNYFKFEALSKLQAIANYLNKDWTKTSSNTGYFMCFSEDGNTLNILEGSSEIFIGAVYFQNKEDCEQATQILNSQIFDLL